MLTSLLSNVTALSQYIILRYHHTRWCTEHRVELLGDCFGLFTRSSSTKINAELAQMISHDLIALALRHSPIPKHSVCVDVVAILIYGDSIGIVNDRRPSSAM